MQKQNPIFDKRHSREYLVYGIFAALVFSVPVWYYLQSARYANGWILFLGSILFMFVMMYYTFRLTRRKSDYESAVTMMLAGHLCVLTGAVISIFFSLILAILYLPGFISSDNHEVYLQNAPPNSSGSFKETLFQILLLATLGNIAAGSFIVVLVSYALKFNQTKDKKASLYSHR